MTLIAEAFVAVRPDLSEFAADLRAKLPTAIGAVGAEHRKVKVLAELDRASINAVKDQLATLTRARTVEITVNLVKPSTAAVDTAIASIPKDVSVDVVAKMNDAAVKEAFASIPKEIIVPVTTAVKDEGKVVVNPDLSGFASELRTKLPTAIGSVGADHRTVGVIAKLDQASVNAVREQLATLTQDRVAVIKADLVKPDTSVVNAALADLPKEVTVAIIPKVNEEIARAELASLPKEITVPVTTTVTGPSRETLAQATQAGAKPVPVKVTPDTTQFGESLRTQVVSKIASIGQVHRQITILPLLTGEFTNSLRTQLRAKIEAIGAAGRSIGVVPILDSAGVAALRERMKGLTITFGAMPKIDVKAAAIALQEQLNTMNLTVRVQGVAEGGVSGLGAALGGVGPSGNAAAAAAAAAARVREQISSGASAALASSSQVVESAQEELQTRIDIVEKGLTTETQGVFAREIALQKAIEAHGKAERLLAEQFIKTAALEAKEGISTEELDKAALLLSEKTRGLSIKEEDVEKAQNDLLLARARLAEVLKRNGGGNLGGTVLTGQLEQAQAEADAQAARLRLETQAGLSRTRESTDLLGSSGLVPKRADADIRSAEDRLREIRTAELAAERDLTAASRSGSAVEFDRLSTRKKLLQTAREETQQALELAKVNALGAQVVGSGSQIDVLRAQTAQSATAEKVANLKFRILGLDEQINTIERDVLKTSAGQNEEALRLLTTLKAQSAEFVRQISLLDRQAPQLRQQAIVQAAADRRASQFQRGVFGGAAGFAGLRGAALAASAPFLLATIGITAVGKAIAGTAELQRQLQTFGATSGATAEQMKRVSDAARVLGADVKLPATSALDAAVALTELSKAGLNVDNTLGAARGTLQLAAAANIEAGDAAQIAASVLNQYELAGSKAARVTDVLAAASIAAQGSITDFAQGFKSLGSVAHTAGFSIEQSAALLTELGRAGLAGADGGTAIRTFLQRLVPQSKEAATAMDSLGVSLDHTRTLGAQLPDLIDQFVAGLSKLDPIARQDTLNQIFGARGIRAATIIFNQGSQSLEQFTSKFQESGAAATLTEARMKGLAGAVDALGSSGSTFATTAGQFVTPALTSITHALTDIVNNATGAAEALAPLLRVSREGIGALPGGGDAVAQAGIVVGAAALVGSQISKNIARRQAAATAAREAALQEVMGEAEVVAATERVTLAAQEQGQVWVASSKGVVAAVDAEILAQNQLQAAIDRATLAQKEQTAAGTLRGRIRGIGAGGGAALGAGLLATLLGQAVGGQGGSALGAAGEGALFGGTLGTFLPIPGGTAIGAGAGAAAFGLLDLLKSSQEKAKEKEQAIKSQWQSMSFAEQQQFLAEHFPNEAEPDAQRNILLESIKEAGNKASAGATTAINQGVEPTTTNVDNTVQENLQRTAVNPRVAQLEKQKELLENARNKFQVIASTAVEGSVAAKNAADKIADLNKQINALNTEIAQAGRAPGQSAADFVAAQGGFNITAEDTKKAAEVLKNSIPDFGAIFESAQTFVRPQNTSVSGSLGLTNEQAFGVTFADQVQKLLEKTGAGIKKAIVAAQTTSKLDLQLKLAMAQASGNSAAAEAAVKELIAFDRTQAAAIEKQLNATIPVLGGSVITGKKRVELQKALIIILNEIGQLNGQLTKSVKDAAEFHISTGTQISVINAGTTPGLADNLAAQRKVLEETNAALEAELAKKKPDKDKVSSLRIAVAQANADIVGTTTTIADQVNQAAETTLRAAADEAGNVGAKERALIAFLKQQIQKNAGNPAAVAAAVVAFQTEQTRMADALKGLRIAAQQVIDQRLQNQLSAAQLTDTPADDKKILNKILGSEFRQLNALIRAADVLKDAGKTGTAKWFETQNAIEGMISKIIGTKSALKSLQDQSQSAAPQDFFKEAVANFRSFGSNIAGRSGVLSAQDARAAFAVQLGANLSTPQSAAERIGEAQVTEQHQTNDWLAKIYGAVSSGAPVSMGGPKKNKGVFEGAGWGAAESAAINGWSAN